MRLSKIVTKTGDTGNTLLGCTLVSKGHKAIDLLGDLDELNVLLGSIEDQEAFQDNVFEISAAVYKGEDWSKIDEELEWLEDLIESMNGYLSPLQEFIRPSGPVHLARAVCRRCERKAWATTPETNYNKYLNRLSDYLFVLARTLDSEETQWKR